MNILIAHNKYRFHGGEEQVVRNESKLLISKGHKVSFYIKDNLNIKYDYDPLVVINAPWSRKTFVELEEIFLNNKPDIIHVHNTFPIISPSIYWIANKHKVPIVQTLHNFRLSCIQGTFLRNGKICEGCNGKSPWKGFVHACYRGSFIDSFAACSVITINRALGSWTNKVDSFISLNIFCKNKFIEIGLPKSKIFVKPNFSDPIHIKKNIKRENSFLFAGRLSVEKGANVLANLFKLKDLKNLKSFRIKIAGTGPLDYLFKPTNKIKILGWLNEKNVAFEMQKAYMLVMPSIYYENFPCAIVEAFSYGLPIIASNRGSIASIIKDGYTGLLFEPGNEQDLLIKIEWALNNPKKINEMRVNVKKEFQKKYNKEINYRQLINIYKKTISKYKYNA